MKKLLGTILAASLFLTTPAFAGDLKIGVIDLQKIIQVSPQVKATDAAFRQEFQPRETKIKVATQKLQADIEQLKRDNAVMTEVQKNTATDKINKERNNLQVMQAQFQQDLQDAQAKAMQKILSQIKTVVNAIAVKGNYDLILQNSEAVYYRASYDVTQQVINGLNKP